ncbi:MAG: pilus assembly protein TadG-related protein [Alphaproteobacteria bacterium]
MSITRKNNLNDERGAFAVILAVAIIPLMFVVGSAIDLSRAYVAKSRLSFALDAAGLAVGAASTQDEDELNEIMQAYFNKNYPSSEIGDEVDLDMTFTNGVVTLSATRRVPTTFMALANYDYLDVYASTQIIRETKGLEVALVLDNTGSMSSNGKIVALRTAATSLINILFGNQEDPENLKVSLVPYVTTVNIGKNNKAYVNFSGTSFTGDDAIDLANTGTTWKGCVKARSYPFNVENEGGGLWPAYIWPKEPRYRGTSGTLTSSCANVSNSSGTAWSYIKEPNIISNSTVSSSGPNKDCPRALVPLSSDKQLLLDEIAAMSPWGSNGTMSHMGIFWGTETLTPEAPFDEGVDWGDEEWNKALIIMTDGINTLTQQHYQYNTSETSSSHYCRNPTTQRPVASSWPNGGPWTHFSGEGYPVDDGLLPLGSGTKAQKYNNMMTLLNTYTAETCEYAKSKGIIVYTITFQLTNTTIQDLYRNCATDPSKYFNSPTSESLQQTFRAIGAELSNLRVSR